MPNNGTVKTKSTPKSVRRWEVFALILVVLIWLWAVYMAQRPDYRLTIYTPHEALSYSSEAHKINPAPPKRWVYSLDAARTPAEQEKGLGGREKLRFSEGMIFLYDGMAERCFWMKDMRFPIDIIWVDEAKKVTAIEHNVDPKTYPNTFCHDAKYVIELKTGEAAKAGIVQGRQLTF